MSDDITLRGNKVVETIDMTPTWRGLLPAILAAIEDGSDTGRKIAIEELYRLADFADAANEQRKAEKVVG